MLGKRSDQKGLWEADRLYLDYVGKDTFYGLLASLRGQLFSDDDFAEIYGPDNGRDSVPPSLLATALLLQTFADAGRQLVARVPGRPDRKHFPKNDFHLDLAAGSCTCPAGQVTRTIVPAGKRTDRTGRVYRLQAFQFDGAVCRVCPLRSQCIRPKAGRDSGCKSIRRKPSYSRLERCSRALPTTSIERDGW